MDAASVNCSKYSFQFKISEKPAIGFAVSEPDAERNVSVVTRGFFYEGGSDFFLVALTHTQQLYLNDFFQKKNIDPSLLRNCLIQISPENEIHVDIDVPLVASVLPKQIPKSGIQKGDPITDDQIADIKEIEFLNVRIKKGWGKIFIFSLKGRRGIYFDFTPIDPKPNYQPDTLERSIATCFAALLFPDLSITYPKIKTDLFKSGWFPFIRLFGPDFQQLSHAIETQSQIDDIEQKIIQSFNDKRLLSIVDFWMKNPLFIEHEVIIRHGVKRFIEGDNICAIHILYPRIEGLLRYLYAKKYKNSPYSFDLRKLLLIETENKNKITNLFLPLDFDEYLRDFYFKHFDVSINDIEVGRHSVSHGVAQDFSRKSAFQAILILDQLNYYI